MQTPPSRLSISTPLAPYKNYQTTRLNPLEKQEILINDFISPWKVNSKAQLNESCKNQEQLPKIRPFQAEELEVEEKHLKIETESFGQFNASTLILEKENRLSLGKQIQFKKAEYRQHLGINLNSQNAEIDEARLELNPFQIYKLQL